jgi:hypothetical protein
MAPVGIVLGCETFLGKLAQEEWEEETPTFSSSVQSLVGVPFRDRDKRRF